LAAQPATTLVQQPLHRTQRLLAPAEVVAPEPVVDGPDFGRRELGLVPKVAMAESTEVTEAAAEGESATRTAGAEVAQAVQAARAAEEPRLKR